MDSEVGEEDEEVVEDEAAEDGEVNTRMTKMSGWRRWTSAIVLGGTGTVAMVDKTERSNDRRATGLKLSCEYTRDSSRNSLIE